MCFPCCPALSQWSLLADIPKTLIRPLLRAHTFGLRNATFLLCFPALMTPSSRAALHKTTSIISKNSFNAFNTLAWLSTLTNASSALPSLSSWVTTSRRWEFDRPMPSHIEAVKDLTAPTNLRKLREFLSLGNFPCHIISHFAEIVHPLTELLRRTKSSSFMISWSAEAPAAFTASK